MWIYHTTQGTQLIFYNNYKWNIIFKNWDSLCCTPETQIISNINYTSKNKHMEFIAVNCGNFCALVTVQNSTSGLDEQLVHMLIYQVTSDQISGGQNCDELTRERKVPGKEQAKQVSLMFTLFAHGRYSVNNC